MDSVDKQQEKAVWQRVCPGTPNPPGLDLRTLELAAQESGNAYRRLWSMSAGKPRQILGQLLEENRRETAMLRGLQTLAHGSFSKPKNPGSPKGTPSEILCRCYHCTRQSLAEYTARTLDPELGCVFQELSCLAQNQCARIAQCLGETDRLPRP